MDADAPTMTGRPTEWVTPMAIVADGSPSTAYASFVSATHISSKTREEVFVVTCAPSKCSGNEVPEQTITQRVEMYVCPGDDDVCPDMDDGDSENASTVTRFGYPLGWSGKAVHDGTTTEWDVSLSVLKDNERSAGATGNDMLTYVATTKVGKDIKATTSTEQNMETPCLLYDHYAFVSVTAGVKDLLKDYPEDMFPMESMPTAAAMSAMEEERKMCSIKTKDSADKASKTSDEGSSKAKETGSTSDDDKDSSKEGKDKEGAGVKTSLSVVLMGTLLALPMILL